MVIRTQSQDLQKKIMDAQPLKFGIDRILSEETSSKQKNSEVNCSAIPPCANCLTSLYRCCRGASGLKEDSGFYNSMIHTSQSLRSYTNCTDAFQAGVKADSSIQISLQKSNTSEASSKRKRSWSRAVFSNLQRKGLEKRFQLQKYITKPDRRQLAATLGLSDAQVKVWFQNRRMKWRHTKEMPKQNYSSSDSTRNAITTADSTHHSSDSDCGSDIDVQTVDT